MSLDGFKGFVKENPTLVNFIRNGEMTWQKFYEIYDLYGPVHSIWDKYVSRATTGVSSFKDIFAMLKNIDMNELQSGITSLQKGIGYVQEFIGSRANKEERKEEVNYEPRPIYKYFDD